MDSQKKFVLVKYPHKNICLKTTGGYSTEEERNIISSAGFVQDTTPLPKLSEEILKKSPHIETEIFYSPIGTGLFGMHTANEACRAKKAIKKVFAEAGIPLYSRKGSLRELL